MLTDLDENQISKILKKLSTEMLEIVSKVVDNLDNLHAPFNIPIGNGLYGIVENFTIDESKDFGNIFITDIFPCISDHLIEETLSIPQAPFGFLGDRKKSSLTDLDLLFFHDPFQAPDDLPKRNSLKIISLASGKDCGRNLMGFGSGGD